MSDDAQEVSPQTIAHEMAIRRTFAIISHPDAGKTTLTEKLLLYSGMVRTAGMVRARKGGKSTSSDWMSMEQERGISITASAMQFRYKGAVINLLDTPGHQDFSEDTYRTLTAADAAVMVIDAGKGVEAQTRKLFAVCKLRGIPVLTFVNKLDLQSRDFFELLGEVEQVLGIKASPVNWPVGSGRAFAGVVNCETRRVNLFQKSQAGGAERALIEECTLEDLPKHQEIEPEIIEKLNFELELLGEAGNKFSKEAFLAGEVTPVFFGSALTNFGVEPFFDSFVNFAPPPHPAIVTKEPSGEQVELDPTTTPFSGFVFKVQANMNPRHRDSMAFLRICSGRFQRDMSVLHHRTNKEIRLSRSYAMAGQGRETVDVAYPGDIVGVINPGAFSIGDTVSCTGGFSFKGMPSFPPEVIGQIRPLDVLKRKAFDKGVTQLCEEGAVQLLYSYDQPQSPPYVAAVGKLQFEVLQYRLEDEYGVRTELETLPYKYSAWLDGDAKILKRTRSSLLVKDTRGRVVILFGSEWEKNYLLEQNPQHKLIDFVN